MGTRWKLSWSRKHREEGIVETGALWVFAGAVTCPVPTSTQPQHLVYFYCFSGPFCPSQPHDYGRAPSPAWADTRAAEGLGEVKVSERSDPEAANAGWWPHCSGFCAAGVPAGGELPCGEPCGLKWECLGMGVMSFRRGICMPSSSLHWEELKKSTCFLN